MRRRVAGLVLLHLLLVSAARLLAGMLPAQGELSFVADYDGNADIFLFDVGRELRLNLTRSPAWDNQPVWSPDGQRLVFESLRDGLRTLYLLDLRSGETRRLLPDTPDTAYNAVWTPDGRGVVFQMYRRPSTIFYGLDLETGGLQPVADGVQLIFQQRQAPAENIELLYKDHAWGIFMHVPGQHEPVRLTRDITFIEPPRWSPDGVTMAFLSDLNRSATEIFVLDVVDGTLRQLTTDGHIKTRLLWRPLR